MPRKTVPPLRPLAEIMREQHAREPEFRRKALENFVDRLVTAGSLKMSVDGKPLLQGKPLTEHTEASLTFRTSSLRRYRFTEQEISEFFIKRHIREKEFASGTPEERWARLDQYAHDNPGLPISKLGKRLFPETLEVSFPPRPLPTTAPMVWPKDRQSDSETPLEFTVRVYGEWMDASALTRTDLKKLDPRLYSSVMNWMSYNEAKPTPEPLPPRFKLLTLQEKNDAWALLVRDGKAPGPADAKEALRLAALLKRRESKGNIIQ